MKGPPAKGGRPPGKCLGETYTTVLGKIAKEGFQSYPELRSSVLTSVTLQHSWKVMKKLSREGLVSECRGDSGSLLGWTLTQKGKTLLQKKGAEAQDEAWRHPIYKTAYAHDLALRETKNILTQSARVSNWIPEHLVRKETMRKYQHLRQQDKVAKLLTVPDGIFQMQAGDQTFTAILELEMTRKTTRRIFHKLESHMTNPDFNFAFFVVDGEPLFKVLWTTYLDVMANSIEVKFQNCSNGIYFTLLETLRKQGSKAKFVSKNDTYSFE